MSSNYASILASRYHSHDDTSMQGEVELAFMVTEVLGDLAGLPDPWEKLLKSARGLIKTRAKRSRTRFRMQYKQTLELSDLNSTIELPGQELPSDREDQFRLRVLNPQFMSRRSTALVSKPEIVPQQEEVIIKEDKSFTKEREDEFTQRISNPRSLRRGN